MRVAEEAQGGGVHKQTSSRGFSATGGMAGRGTTMPSDDTGPGSANLGAAEGQALIASRPSAEGTAAAPEEIDSGGAPAAPGRGERPLIVLRVHSVASSRARDAPGPAPHTRCAACPWQVCGCSAPLFPSGLARCADVP